MARADVLQFIMFSGSPRSTEEATKMKGYAEALWKYAYDSKVPPRFISVIPDNERIVISVKDQKAKDTLIAKLKKDKNYRFSESNVRKGDFQFYSKNPETSSYEVKVALEQKAYLC
jgi:hypothetical protein